MFDNQPYYNNFERRLCPNQINVKKNIFVPFIESYGGKGFVPQQSL